MPPALHSGPEVFVFIHYLLFTGHANAAYLLSTHESCKQKIQRNNAKSATHQQSSQAVQRAV